jgi:hypothetical protein
VQTQSQVLGLETEIDSLGHAVFGLDRRGRMILSNRQAESITQVGDAIRLLSGEMLVSVFPEQNQRLQACLSSAIAVGAGIGASSGGSLLLNRKSDRSGFCKRPGQPAAIARRNAACALCAYSGRGSHSRPAAARTGNARCCQWDGADA